MLRKPGFWIFVTLVAALFILVYPVYVIRPFRFQGPHELAAALGILRIRPWLQMALALTAAASFALYWPKGRVLGRVSLGLMAGLVIGCGVLSRVNIYEQMFHPLDRPEFASAAKTKLDAAEEVIAVRMNNAARAYPIRSMSYHHIVNDTLGGVPIVATY